MERSVLAGLTVAALIALGGAAAPAAPSQRSVRVRIMERDCARCGVASGTFVLEPYTGGVLLSDHGTFTFRSGKTRIVYRDGQAVKVTDRVDILVGQLGRLVVRRHAETVEAGYGNRIVSGRWSVTSGTGVYATARGSGRTAGMLPGRPVRYATGQYEGFVHV